MKQHMLTHKIRDMPPRLFEPSKPAAGPGAGPGAGSGAAQGSPLPLPHGANPPRGPSAEPPSHQGSPSPLQDKTGSGSNGGGSEETPRPPAPTPLPLALSMTMPADVLKAEAVKRSPPEGGAIPPVPKRQPSKYLTKLVITLG